MKRFGACIASLVVASSVTAQGEPAKESQPPATAPPAQPEAPAEPRKQPPALERLTLDNGVTVLLQRVDGVGWVGVNTLYKVGFFDEPSAQVAHLVEHLRCFGASESYAPKAAMDAMSKLGMANAETMPTFTHYDAFVPTFALPDVLKIESERLTSLRVDEALIAQESPRCAAEVEGVEKHPQAPVMKFAFMAAAQRWRHGKDDVPVKAGIGSIGLEGIESFRAAHYRPENLVLAIVGDFPQEETVALIRERFGSIAPVGDPAPAAPIDWAALPPEMEVTWDSTASSVILTYPPPADANETAILGLWCNVLNIALMRDEEIKPYVRTAACSNYTWPPGELPVFVYATLAPGADPKEAIAKLSERVDLMTGEVRVAGEVQQVQMAASQWAGPPPAGPTRVRNEAQRLQQARGMDPDHALGMVLGNLALQSNMRESSLGTNGNAVMAAANGMDDAKLTAIVQAAFDPAKRRVTILKPRD